MRVEYVMSAILLALSAESVAADPPAVLNPPADEVLSLQTKARGVQIYTCSPRKDDPSKYEWTLKAPEAELRDLGGKRIGTHYAGPTWESDDGSKVTGEVKARDPGPDAASIPWLLLAAKSNSGNGVFARTTSIQRLDTSGGVAPADGCDAKRVGSEAGVPYTASYNFFSKK